MNRCGKDQRKALFYVNQTVLNNWSRATLLNFIQSDLYARQGKAVTNFGRSLTLDVRVDAEKETVRLTQAEMAELFGVDRTRITRHVHSIRLDEEIDLKAMCGKSTLQMPIARRRFMAWT